MHEDVNSKGQNQWYYFSVSNMKAGQEYRLIIRNFAKSDSLYNMGLRPLMLSVKGKRGWERCGKDVIYFQNTLSQIAVVPNSSTISESSDVSTGIGTYSLSFNIVFERSDDLVYFAYSHPYTYSDLQRYVNEADKCPKRNQNLRIRTLCRTIAGNDCHLLTITAPCRSPEDLIIRPVVVLTARVHPGETNASWIMQGMIEFLTSDSVEAEAMRHRYVFKMVPMLNIDGVINGNYRTNLAGVDLNRRWNAPNKEQHPTVYFTKAMVRRLKQTRTIATILDLHGHSRKHGKTASSVWKNTDRKLTSARIKNCKTE
jgi:cytosolic carboxypeptidase protein 2/3